MDYCISIISYHIKPELDTTVMSQICFAVKRNSSLFQKLAPHPLKKELEIHHLFVD